MSEFSRCLTVESLSPCKPTVMMITSSFIKFLGRHAKFVFVLVMQLVLYVPIRVAAIGLQMILHTCIATCIGKELPQLRCGVRSGEMGRPLSTSKHDPEDQPLCESRQACQFLHRQAHSALRGGERCTSG